MKQFIQDNPITAFLSSMKITVGCLLLLFILTFWGTVAQVDQGLYLAQQKFFYSWGFLAFGFVPFPGARLVLWVFFINLLLNTILRFRYDWGHIGIVIIHIGLLFYFVAAFINFHMATESHLTLLEGEGSNTAQAYHQWELSVWEPTNGPDKTIYAYDTRGLQSGATLAFKKFGFNLSVEDYYANAEAYTSQQANNPPVNASGITRLAEKHWEKKPEKNMPGLLAEVQTPAGSPFEVLLFGAEGKPTQIKIGKQTLDMQLRRKRYPLPVFLRLKEFRKTMHPGTNIAKSYQSKVAVTHQGVTTDARIYMNHPLHIGTFTFYQAAYSVDQLGRERSTLAVVKNIGRWLPYVTSLITFLGLALHFILMGFKSGKSTS